MNTPNTHNTIGNYHDKEFHFQTIVQRQVEHEAWVDWAQTPTIVPPIVPALTKPKPLTEEVLHIIFSGVRGFIHP